MTCIGVRAFTGVRNFVTKVGVDTIRSELARRVPSFKPPDKDINVVFGPD
ncbi:hypothetical protein [Vulcanisaeta distributa]|nr:hypothetical protein [Vulcanisaeta distributa]